MAYINKPKKNYTRVPTIRMKEYQDIYQDKRWKKLRAIKMKTNPLCEVCEQKGKVKPLDEVHHIKPFDEGKTPEEREALAFDYDNLLSVCFDCHELLHKMMK